MNAADSNYQIDTADEIDLGRLLEILLDGKWLILGLTLAGVLLGGLYVQTATPIYSGNTLLQVERPRGPMAGLGDLGVQEQRETTAELQLLQSRLVIGSVVDELDLTLRAAPEPGAWWAGLLGDRDAARIKLQRLELPAHMIGVPLRLVYQGDGAFTVNSAATEHRLAEGRVGQPLEFASGGGEPDGVLLVSQLHAEPGRAFQVWRLPRLAAIGSVLRAISVSEAGDSGILRVSMEHPDRQHIEQVLNALANAYLRQNVDYRSQEGQRRLDFLQQQVPRLRADVHAAEEAYNAFRRDNRTLSLGDESEALLKRYLEIDTELQRLRVEESELRLQLGSEHPRSANLRERRRQQEEIRAELDAAMGGVPEREQELLRLQREMQVTTELYTSLLNTSQELRIAQAGIIGNVRIVDDAITGSNAVQPRTALILALSLMLGGMLGVMAVFGREMFRRGIRDPDALEQSLGQPVYAVIPQSKRQRRLDRRAKKGREPTGLLARDHPTELTVESLRSLRTSLGFALLGDAGNVVTLASPGPAAGKTFLSFNLAWLMAQGDQRVLVIDCDLRRGHAHTYLESRYQRRQPGLSEVLAGQASADQAITRGDIAGVDVLTSGSLPPNPSELLMRPAFRQLVQQQSQRYDLVLLDTPPVLAVADGIIVASQADATLLVLRAGVTTEREAKTALRRLEQNGIRVNGLLVNGFQTKREAYGEYYYQYSYRSERSDA